MSTKAKKVSSRKPQVNDRETFFLTFAESNKEKWKNGWRPEKKLIKNHINKKKKLFMKSREL